MVVSNAFRDFEHAGWGNDTVAIAYHRHLGEVTSGCIPELIRAANLKAGDKVLDVACGAGYVAAAARDRGLRLSVWTSPQLRFALQSKRIRTSDL